MPCPNKKNDEQIIAAIAKRKAAKATSIVEQPYVNQIYEGRLFDLQFIGIDENRIASIRRLRENTWEILLNNIP